LSNHPKLSQDFVDVETQMLNEKEQAVFLVDNLVCKTRKEVLSHSEAVSTNPIKIFELLINLFPGV